MEKQKKLIKNALKLNQRVQVVNVNGNERVLINGLYYFDNTKKREQRSQLKGWVFSDMVKCIYKTIDAHPTVRYPVYNSYSRKKVIEKMDEVALVDIDHCYLQVAHKLGYLLEKDYLRILKRYSEIKIDVCAAFTSLFKEVKCTYIGSNGKVQREIECYNYELEQVRDNIINYSYGIMAQWKGDYYSRNVDGIWIPIKELPALEDYLKALGLKYKIKSGKYITDDMLFDNTLKKIIHL